MVIIGKRERNAAGGVSPLHGIGYDSRPYARCQQTESRHSGRTKEVCNTNTLGHPTPPVNALWRVARPNQQRAPQTVTASDVAGSVADG